jgi:hypothetical protein
MDERLIFNESSNQDAYSVEETTDGYYVIVGEMQVPGSNSQAKMVLLKTDSQGNRIF